MLPEFGDDHVHVCVLGSVRFLCQRTLRTDVSPPGKLPNAANFEDVILQWRTEIP